MTASGVFNLLGLSGGILGLLALLLLMALAVIIERAWFFAYVSRAALADPGGEPSAERSALRDYGERRRGTPEGEFARFALVRLDLPVQALEQTLEQHVLTILPTLDRRLWMLDATVTLAPLFGLLGTIVGMFQTFNILGNHAANAPAATGGIAEALVSTGAGLLVAIVAVIGLSICNNRVREFVRRLDSVKLAALAIAGQEQSQRLQAVRPHVVAGIDHPLRKD